MWRGCGGQSSLVGRGSGADDGSIVSFCIVDSACNLELLLSGMPAISIYNNEGHEHSQVRALECRKRVAIYLEAMEFESHLFFFLA